MGELAERTWAVAGRAAGNTVGPAVTALMTATGVALGHPELLTWAVPTGALTGSMTEEGMALVRAAWEDNAKRVKRFAETAADDAGTPIEDVVAAAAGDPRLRDLLARAVEAATTSLDDEKIDIFARAFARGAQDDTLIDEMRLLVGLVHDLEIGHIRALRAILDVTDSDPDRTPDAPATRTQERSSRT